MKHPMGTTRALLMALLLLAGVAEGNEPAGPVVDTLVVSADTSVAAPAESNGFRLKAEPARGESGGMAAATVQMVLGLGVVLAVIFALSWLAKRLNLNASGSANGLRVISAMTIGPKEKIVMLEVEGKRLLLGVTSQQITLLQTLEDTVSAPESVMSVGGGFAEKMQAWLKAGAVHEKQ